MLIYIHEEFLFLKLIDVAVDESVCFFVVIDETIRLWLLIPNFHSYFHRSCIYYVLAYAITVRAGICNCQERCVYTGFEW